MDLGFRVSSQGGWGLGCHFLGSVLRVSCLLGV